MKILRIKKYTSNIHTLNSIWFFATKLQTLKTPHLLYYLQSTVQLTLTAKITTHILPSLQIPLKYDASCETTYQLLFSFYQNYIQYLHFIPSSSNKTSPIRENKCFLFVYCQEKPLLYQNSASVHTSISVIGQFDESKSEFFQKLPIIDWSEKLQLLFIS